MMCGLFMRFKAKPMLTR